MFIVFGRDISRVLQIHELSLDPKPIHMISTGWSLTHSLTSSCYNNMKWTREISLHPKTNHMISYRVINHSLVPVLVILFCIHFQHVCHHLSPAQTKLQRGVNKGKGFHCMCAKFHRLYHHLFIILNWSLMMLCKISP